MLLEHDRRTLCNHLVGGNMSVDMFASATTRCSRHSIPIRMYREDTRILFVAFAQVIRGMLEDAIRELKL